MAPVDCPEFIGKYRVDGQLGRGGFGVVYSAMDPGLGRAVAIKGLIDAHSNPAELIREGQVLAGLSHPNIVSVLDAFTWQGRLMIVMEKVPGQTLTKWLQSSPRPRLMDRVSILVQLVGAMGHAHAAGVQHRDLKPGNVMVTPDGVVKVLDFGISRRRESRNQAAGVVDPSTNLRGTLQYMAPEQLLQHKSGFASDVFAFGGVAYELLSGEHPFQGETDYLVQHAIVSHLPRPLHNVVPGLPEFLSKVIERCLEKEPALRYRNLDDAARVVLRAVYQLEEAEARRLAMRGLQALDGGNRDLAEQMAEQAERLNRGCTVLHELLNRLWQTVDERARRLDEIRRRVKEGSLQDLLAARTLLESAGKEYGWSTELVEMRERIQKVLWDREHANREGARFLLGLAAGLGLLLVAIVGFALWMTNRDTTETYFPNAGRPPFVGDVLKNPKDALHYVWVPPGTLTVGCLGSDTGCQGDESPRPLKRFDRGFWIGQTEVTDRAFDHLMQRGSSLDVWSIPSPARFVTWSEAQEFCKRAGAVLPSREQLEYAARGGASTVRYGELDTIAWYSGNAERQVHPVGKKQPNAYRLYDVLGNVWEWTATQSPAGFYVLFGGSFDSPPDLVRVSSQFRVEPQRRAGDIGFRCVLTPETNTP